MNKENHFPSLAFPDAVHQQKLTQNESLLKKPPSRVPLDGTGDLRKLRVVLRVRPCLPNETDHQSESCIKIKTDPQKKHGKIIEISNHRNLNEEFQYQFDNCHDGCSTTREIFKANIVPLLPDLFRGINTTIFAYGNTGAGKTFTMDGTKDHPGLIPLALEYLFTKVSASEALNMSYMEIYNEKVYDLLARFPFSTDLCINEDHNRNIRIPGLSQIPIKSMGEFYELWNNGRKNRSTAPTSLNTSSSRSHSVLLVQIEPLDKTVVTHGNVPFTMQPAKLHLIDLAGSEDNRKAKNTGERLTESGAINTSLFVLSKVVDALNKNDLHIPYRDSKLTRLLQDSLGGKARALMIANISPRYDHLLESNNTLNFASKSRQVVNRVQAALLLDHHPHSSSMLVPNGQASKAKDDRKERLNQWKGKLQQAAATHSGVQRPVEKRLDATAKAQCSRADFSTKRGHLADIHQYLTPGTRLKTSKAFYKRAQDYELIGQHEQALESYKAALEVCKHDGLLEAKIREKMAALGKSIPTNSSGKAFLERLPPPKLDPADSASQTPTMKMNRKKRKLKNIIEEEEEEDAMKQDIYALDRLFGHSEAKLRAIIESEILEILNRGSAKRIKELPAIGDKRCQAILEARETHFPFTKIEDLVSKCSLTNNVLTSLVQSYMGKKVDEVKDTT